MHDQHRFLIPQEVTNKLTLSPGDFIETEQDSLLMKRLSDQITALGRDMGVILAEDLSIVSI
jgi:bifunctional DNA-binding transcriptional regulator/antitoxin component of YhaV-PrlF toxin-antitoxin module